MSDLNQVTIVGRLGRDPDVRTLSTGDDVVNLSVATTEKWKDKSGEKQERTEWHKVVLFGGLAGIAAKYLSKGDQALFQGQLRTRSWEQDGQKRYSTEISLSGPSAKLILLGGGSGAGGGGKQVKDEPMARAPHPHYDEDDDIPF